MNAEEKYPLPADEQRRLENEMLASDTALIVVGIILSIIVTGISSGDWGWSIFYFGWAYELGQTLVLANPIRDIAFVIAIPTAFLAVDTIIERIGMKRWESFRKDVYLTRAGVTGEIPRMPLPKMAVLMAFVGFAEEFVFRYCAIGLLYQMFAIFLEGPWAVVCAVAVSSAVFAFVHAQYSSPWQKTFVALVGVVLAFVFLMTGSLIVVAAVHALYDFGEILVERRKMVRDDKYFGEYGPATDAIKQLVKRILDEHGMDDEDPDDVI